MGLGGASLVGQDEAGTDPDAGSAQHEGGGEGVAVEETTSGDNLDGLAGHGALLASTELGDGRDENSGGDITGVPTALTTLGADDIGTGIEGLLDVLGVADHVHVEDTGLVESLDDVLGGNTDGGNEELGTALDDDVDQLIELTLGVVVARDDVR